VRPSYYPHSDIALLSRILTGTSRYPRGGTSSQVPLSHRRRSVGRGWCPLKDETHRCLTVSPCRQFPTFVLPCPLGPTHPIGLVPLYSRTCLHMCPLLGCSLALKESRSDASAIANSTTVGEPLEGQESEVVVGSGKRTAPHRNKPEDIRHSTFWNMASSNGHGLEGRFTAVIKLVSSPKSHLSCV
jgi:hypothetical protein